jgi:mRNA-degrading endonuclease RelE of RelBE toxin-antitoxin system
MRIVRTTRYLKDIKKLKASPADVDAMERMIAAMPETGALIQGLKGVRKARFRIGNRGKSGGGRVLYFVVTSEGVVAMLMAYTKAEKSDLSPEDRGSVLRALEEIGL